MNTEFVSNFSISGSYYMRNHRQGVRPAMLYLFGQRAMRSGN